MSRCYQKNSLANGILWLILILLFNFAWDSGYSPAQAVETISLPHQTVAPGEATLTVNLELPAGCKLNQEAPSTVTIKSSDANIAAVDFVRNYVGGQTDSAITLTIPVKEGKTTVQADFRLNFCDEKLGLCYLKEAVLNLPVEVNKSAKNNKMEITYKVQAN